MKTRLERAARRVLPLVAALLVVGYARELVTPRFSSAAPPLRLATPSSTAAFPSGAPPSRLPCSDRECSDLLSARSSGEPAAPRSPEPETPFTRSRP